MYAELYRFLGRVLGIPNNASKDDPSDVERDAFKKYEIAINDPQLAREEFRRFPIPSAESLCISILSGYYEVLLNLNPDLARKFRDRLDEFIAGHNLRYALTLDCKFELTIQGLLMTQYAYLHNSISNSRDRSECLKELEISLSRLNNSGEEKNSIRIASNLLEGVAIDRCSGTAETLGAAIDRCQGIFPHKILNECIKNFYKFCSDYPNIRHAGRSTSRVRDLKKDDALMIIALTMGFGLFIRNDSASESILSGDL